jgi:hypothetical protein
LTYWVMCQQLPEECLPRRFITNDSTLTQVDILGDVSAAAGEVPPPEVRYFGIDTETSHEILQDLRNVTMPALGRGF